MHATSFAILPFVFVFAILALAFVAMLVLVLLFLSLRKSSRSGSGGETEGERQLVQKIHANLERMEKRIESLETIMTEELKEETK